MFCGKLCHAVAKTLVNAGRHNPDWTLFVRTSVANRPVAAVLHACTACWMLSLYESKAFALALALLAVRPGAQPERTARLPPQHVLSQLASLGRILCHVSRLWFKLPRIINIAHMEARGVHLDHVDVVVTHEDDASFDLHGLDCMHNHRAYALFIVIDKLGVDIIISSCRPCHTIVGGHCQNATLTPVVLLMDSVIWH